MSDTPIVPGGAKLALILNGLEVELKFRFSDHYAAIRFHDSLTKAAKESGSLSIACLGCSLEPTE